MGVNAVHPSLSRRWYAFLAETSLMAVILIGAMVPWYTLRLIPIATFGTAKLNPFDVLTACAILLAVPAIIRGLRAGPRHLLWIPVFVLYMAVPLAEGLRHNDSFLAIRESRAFPFYLLALAFCLQGHRASHLMRFAALYVFGAVIAMLAVFAHVYGLLPLPGYPRSVPPLSHLLLAWPGVQYLEWTVPISAFTIGFAGALGAPTRWTRPLWGAGVFIIAVYVLATSERFLQALVVGITAAFLAAPAFGGFKSRRYLALGIVLALAVAFVLSASTSITWLKSPVKGALYRWSRLGSDDSVSFRVQEMSEGVPRFLAHPLIGEGLGGLVMRDNPEHPGQPWPYVSSGYEFLLIKTGTVGLALYLGMVGSALRIGIGHSAPSESRTKWPVAAAGVAGACALLAINFLDSSIDTPDGALAFSLFYGMMMTPDRNAQGSIGPST